MNHLMVIKELKRHADKNNLIGMTKFGINPDNAFGVRIPILRKLAKDIGKDHDLALKLWDTGFHEARILAAFIDDPKKVTIDQMDKWTHDFDSWDLCDQCTNKLFDKTPYAYDMIRKWESNEETFIRRAAFALLATMAVHDKKSPDTFFEEFFPVIIERADDDRNFVRKAVNWALRQIGKRSMYLNDKALETCGKIITRFPDSKSARWIASDAIKELKDEKTIARIRKKDEKKAVSKK